MPNLRIVTWNSGGESGNRGAQLENDVRDINNHFAGGNNGSPNPVQLVVIQEANSNGGSIRGVLTAPFGPTSPFQNFTQQPNVVQEHVPQGTGQIGRVTPSKAYLTSWMATNPGLGANFALNSLGNAALVHLGTTQPNPDLSVCNFINNSFWPTAQYMYVAENMRWPIYQHFRYPFIQLGAQVNADVHFFSWHAPLALNWLQAVQAPFQPPSIALPFAFQVFQNSTLFTNVMGNLGANDVVIIAGDLNVNAQTINTTPGLLPAFVGVSDNLTHIFAFSGIGHNNATVTENHSYVTPYLPHTILTALVSW